MAWTFDALLPTFDATNYTMDGQAPTGTYTPMRGLRRRKLSAKARQHYTLSRQKQPASRN